MPKLSKISALPNTNYHNKSSASQLECLVITKFDYLSHRSNIILECLNFNNGLFLFKNVID